MKKKPEFKTTDANVESASKMPQRNAPLIAVKIEDLPQLIQGIKALEVTTIEEAMLLTNPQLKSKMNNEELFLKAHSAIHKAALLLERAGEVKHLKKCELHALNSLIREASSATQYLANQNSDIKLP